MALSADAMSVVICNLFANSHMTRAERLSMPLMFGLFQGLMPLLGFYCASIARDFIETYAGIVTFVILGIIGAKMAWDGVKEYRSGCLCEGEEACALKSGYKFSVILLQAFATSIDAFAVGISFSAHGTAIGLAAVIIGICTALLCVLALVVGKKLGEAIGVRAQIIGGVVLILIGLKALLF